MSLDDEKRGAAEAAVELVENGMTVGLGTGSTVAHLLTALVARSLEIRCVSTSPRTEEVARNLDLRTEDFATVQRIDLAIDGADQVAQDFWLIKGGGGAHTREKIVAAAADRFVVIADSSKPVGRLHGAVPVELHRFGVQSTITRLDQVTLRDVSPSPDGGLIGDWVGDLSDPRAVAAMLSAAPGVIDHGLFAPELVSDVIIGRGADAVWLERRA